MTWEMIAILWISHVLAFAVGAYWGFKCLDCPEITSELLDEEKEG